MTTTTPTIAGLDSSVLLGYYNAQLNVNMVRAATNAATTQAASGSVTNSATANDDIPWEQTAHPTQQAQDAKVLGLTNFIDTSNVPTGTPGSADAKTEQDNQKLFSLYSAVNNLSYLASMAQRSGMTSGQLAGFNTRFQQGLQQVESYISSATFNDFTLQSAAPSSSVTSTVSVPFAPSSYTGGTIVSDANAGNGLSGVNSSESFDVTVKKGGVSTDVAIDLSQISGSLTIDNVVNYVNQQLSAAGFKSTFSRVMTKGSIDDPSTVSYGIAINPAPNEALSLSSSQAAPAIYLAGNSGIASTTTTGTDASGNIESAPPDQQGRLTKLTNLASSPQSVFSRTEAPTTGNTTAQSTVVDSQGNVYVVGNATGDFGNQLNQGSQDVYLSKYDSAGNLQWTQLLGSAGSASAYSLALDPTGGVVVAGSTTADLMTSAIADGNNDSFAAKYDADGNQTWVQQLQTLAANQANAVTVDSSGNVYIGGQVSGELGAGQIKAGGSDAYLAKLDADGNLVYEQQFGTAGSDSVAATAAMADGSVVVASVQNGEAILSKYAAGDTASAPVWTQDLGALQPGGSIGGLTVSGSNIYVSGTTQNGNLTAGGQAAIANPSTGGQDAFVMDLTDNGSSAAANQISYVGTSASDSGGNVTTGPDGTVYLTGTTQGTFAGQVRNVANTSNAFVTALSPDGTVQWTRQFGGADGQSTGQGVAVDTQGSSVLDALGLPRGTVDINQTVDLTSLSTLRAGDSFQIQTQGTGGRTATITIDQGETLQSLADKINDALLTKGKATVTFANGGEALQIAVNAGVSATLIAGPTDSDALARLGIAPGTITKAAASSSSSSSNPSSTSSSSASSTSHVFGLGLNATDLDISTATSAGAAHAELQNMLSSITNFYQVINAPPASPSTIASSASSGPVPAYLTAQIANYQMALQQITAATSTSSGTTA